MVITVNSTVFVCSEVAKIVKGLLTRERKDVEIYGDEFCGGHFTIYTNIGL